MKLFLTFIAVIGIFSYSIINLIYPQRDVYISSQIANQQVEYIENSIDKMGLIRTYDKDSNHIRIEYCELCYGITLWYNPYEFYINVIR